MNYALRFLLMALCVGAILSSGSIPAEAQTYEVTVLNQTTLGVGAFQFDLYVTNTGTAWRIANANFELTYNYQAFTSRTISYVLGSSQLAAGYGVDPQINTASIKIDIQSPDTYAASTEISTTIRIGTFRVSTIVNPSANMNLAWRTDLGEYQVMLERLNNNNRSDITNPTPTTYIAPDNAPLPIQLASIRASVVRDNDVEVAWKTISETNNYGYEVYRKRGEAGDWLKIGFFEGHGTTLIPQTYSYIDRSVAFGKYLYRIKQIDLDGMSETFPEMEVTVGTGPDKFVLAQNYPNPFNPSTVVEFVVPLTGHTTMRVYDVLGQEVATLFDGNAEAGRINTAQFDASNLPSGMYFYTLRSMGKLETKRMLLLK
jgi:hypothetical protein